MHRFHTHGKRLFAELDATPSGDRDYEEYPTGQHVFDHVTPLFFKRLDYDAEVVGAYWTLGKDRPVVLKA